MVKITKDPVAIIGAMMQHEQALARLYEFYAEKFLECKDFWADLSREEIQHANWLDALQAEIEDGSEDFVVERFSLATLEHSLNYVRELRARAKESNFLLMNALSTALQLEKALIENKYFEVLGGDNAETKRTLDKLAQSTKIHYEKLHKLWREYGGE
jgi:hypothetical protein